MTNSGPNGMWPHCLGATCSHTLEKSPLHVSSAATLPDSPKIWSITCFHTPARNLLHVRNATTYAKSPTSWRFTWESTVQKLTNDMTEIFLDGKCIDALCKTCIFQSLWTNKSTLTLTIASKFCPFICNFLWLWNQNENQYIWVILWHMNCGNLAIPTWWWWRLSWWCWVIIDDDNNWWEGWVI